MNEKVKEFLDAKKKAEQKKYAEEKQKTLIALGLFEKVYSPNNTYSAEFPVYEYDSVSGKNKWYKKVPIEITDEEYQEVKKYAKKEESSKTNPIASILTALAWIVFIGGFIAGLVFGTVEVESSYYSEAEFSLAAAFVYWCDAFIYGTIFLVFAEIIKLLEAIKNK